MKRFALLMVLMIVLSAADSCSQEAGQTPAAPAAPAAQTPTAARADIQVAVFERGNTTNTYGTATDNFWTRWVQSEFGDPNNIGVTYIPIPRSEEAAKLNTLMASGTAPDVVFSYDTNMILGFGKDGGLVVLDDLIAQYGPNITANLSSSLPYGSYNGEQLAIPAVRAKVGRYTTFIRKDWTDQMGYDFQTNSDGFYHMSLGDFDKLLYDAKSTDFDETGMEVFPLGVAGAYNATQQKGLIFAYVDNSKVTDQMVASTPQMLWPGFKDGVAYLNKLYNDKIIDPDFMVDTDTALPSLNTLVSTGRTLALSQDDMYSNGIKALYDSNADAEFVAFQLDNKYGEQIITTYQPIGMYSAIPASSKNPEAAMKYLNFLADYDTCKVLAYGFEGVHYEMIDGSPVTIAHTDEEKAADTANDYERITCGDMNLLFNGQPFGYKTSLVNVSETDARYGVMYDQAYVLSTFGGRPEYNFSGIRTAAEEQYDGFITGLETYLPQLISCPASEFETLWTQVTTEYLDNGGQAIIDEKAELFLELEANK
jgi:putative aldouronate transport system substrate-binding protein